jgi:uncharacterized membrane protein YagU involved in acid resistance
MTDPSDTVPAPVDIDETSPPPSESHRQLNTGDPPPKAVPKNPPTSGFRASSVKRPPRQKQRHTVHPSLMILALLGVATALGAATEGATYLDAERSRVHDMRIHTVWEDGPDQLSLGAVCPGLLERPPENSSSDDPPGGEDSGPKLPGVTPAADTVASPQEADTPLYNADDDPAPPEAGTTRATDPRAASLQQPALLREIEGVIGASAPTLESAHSYTSKRQLSVAHISRGVAAWAGIVGALCALWIGAAVPHSRRPEPKSKRVAEARPPADSALGKLREFEAQHPRVYAFVLIAMQVFGFSIVLHHVILPLPWSEHESLTPQGSAEWAFWPLNNVFSWLAGEASLGVRVAFPPAFAAIGAVSVAGVWFGGGTWRTTRAVRMGALGCLCSVVGALGYFGWSGEELAYHRNAKHDVVASFLTMTAPEPLVQLCCEKADSPFCIKVSEAYSDRKQKEAQEEPESVQLNVHVTPAGKQIQDAPVPVPPSTR